MILEKLILRIYESLHKRIGNELDEEAMKQSAVIFAPHPDDETLGCGGTIIRKIQAGAEVVVVFMTDGSRSHSTIMPRKQLGVIRKQEAIDAACLLGVPKEDIIFMDYINGRIDVDSETVLEGIRNILRRLRPKQIFVPCPQEKVRDHVATHRIVMNAMNGINMEPLIFEYPVWFWMHWPWIGIDFRHPFRSLEIIRNSILAGFGMKMIFRFRTGVHIGDIVDMKRNALLAYRTQMTRVRPEKNWPILSDIAEGKFLRCFFQDYEYFHSYLWKFQEVESGWPMVMNGDYKNISTG